MKYKFEVPFTPQNIYDENSRYLKSACAGWLRGIFDLRPRLDRHTLEFLFWLAGDDDDRAEYLLEVLLSDSDRERLLPEIKKAWGDADEMANVVWMVIGRSAPGHQVTSVQKLKACLDEWSTERSTMAESALARQLERARKTFGLSDAETELCFFLGVMEWYTAPRHYFDSHLSCDQSDGRALLQSALGWDYAKLGSALNGKPQRIGLLDRRGSTLSVDNSFIGFFVDPTEAPTTNDLFRKSPSTNLPSYDLGLRDADLHLVRQLLSAPSKRGMHLLFYGPPGTGKTTLARAMIGELELGGLEVLGVNDNRSGSRRAALAACLEMAAGNERAVVLIDEADKILGTNQSWFSGGEVSDKGWLTRIIEDSDARVIWIVNDVTAIDPAVMRRFAHSLEMPLPGLKVRVSMLDNVLRRAGIKRHFTAEQIIELANEFRVAPAVFASAATTARLASSKPRQVRDAFHQTLTAKLNLFGVEQPLRSTRAKESFLVEAVNPAGGLNDLVTRVTVYESLWDKKDSLVPAMAMLFHGDPGTGKSLAARYLAELVDREVVTRRASDLLGKYVGESEQNIAAAFREAAASGSVLILDEIDTFLQPRSRAHRNWEASLVNEMLVQLENHQGLVIATTNRIDGLDPAAMRRFVVKTEFRCLAGAQVVAAYEAILGSCGRGALQKNHLVRLGWINNLTAADLANVRRNHALLGRRRIAHDYLIGDLELEVGHKQHSHNPRIGFVSPSPPVSALPTEECTDRRMSGSVG